MAPRLIRERLFYRADVHAVLPCQSLIAEICFDVRQQCQPLAACRPDAYDIHVKQLGLWQCLAACHKLGTALLPFVAPHLQHQVRATVGEGVAR